VSLLHNAIPLKRTPFETNSVPPTESRIDIRSVRGAASGHILRRGFGSDGRRDRTGFHRGGHVG
jgi:hypothetical protein